MPALPTRTSVKLIGGFLAILSLFFFAAVLTLRSLQIVEKSNATLEEISEGVRTGRMMTDIVRDQYIQLTQFIITRDWSCVDRFEELSRRMGPLKKSVSTQTVWTEDEKRVIAMLDEAHRQFEMLFETELSDAVYQNNIDSVQRIRRQSESLLQQVFSLNANLEQMFLRKMKVARARQRSVAASAKTAPFIFFGAAVVLSLLIVAYLGRSIADPIRKLILGTQEIARGDLSARIQLKRHDEFGQLAESFNRMTQQLREHQQRLIQSEKMASLGQLAAGVAHEINNPIGVILGYIKILLADLHPGDPHYDELKAIEEEARQCQRIVNELRNFSRPIELSLESVDVREVADEALARLDHFDKASEPHITLIKDYASAPQHVWADRGKLREVFLNILQNAVDAMPQGGQLKVAIRYKTAAEQTTTPDSQHNLVLIQISDTGCGIPQEHMKRLFEPFFSTKERGMGLGLAISYSIVKAHKGFIEATSEPGKGATFTIGLPVAEQASASTPITYLQESSHHE